MHIPGLQKCIVFRHPVRQAVGRGYLIRFVFMAAKGCKLWEKMKRGICLYRVSTVGQMDHDDIKSSSGRVNIRTGNGTSYSRITAVAPGTTLEYVASAFNGWQAVKIGSQVGWVSGEYSVITTE